MTREKFPEKIPFRLTRMLTNAMEVGVAYVPYTLLYSLLLKQHVYIVYMEGVVWADTLHTSQWYMYLAITTHHMPA